MTDAAIKRYRVTIRPSSAGGIAAYINGTDEEFESETQAYLHSLDSVNTSTRWGARKWARRRVKRLARTAGDRTEVFEIEVSG
jgi:hypothetical protein